MFYYQNAGPTPPPPLHGDELRLYHIHMNPYSHRVLLILEAKKLRYEVVRLDPLHFPEWFERNNPRLKIPALEVAAGKGDHLLFESIVICDYLDEKYPRNPLHSADPLVKAQDRLLIERFNELIKGSLLCFETAFASGGEQIIGTLQVFEEKLNTRGTYFGGDRPGMLDFMIWPWIERLYLLKCVNERKFNETFLTLPNLADWGEQMQLEDVVKKHASSPQNYFDYYKNAKTHPMDYSM